MASATRATRHELRRMGERRLLLVLVLGVLALRMPFVGAPLGIDEGGYAYVAANWQVGDGGIYGAQWVDRPPLLFVLYAVAIALAGDVGVRLLGCAAAVLLVLSCASLAHRLAGRSAMAWAGGAALVLSSSTLWQAHVVNAELPAAALVAAAAWATVAAVQAGSGRRAWFGGVAAGLLAASALLVKQSFVDGFVFAGALLAALVVLDPGRRRRAAVVLGGGGVGAIVAAWLLVAWAELNGPGIGQLLEALYGFRVEARATIDASDAPRERAVLLLALVAMSGLLTLFAFSWIGMVRIASGRQRVRTGLDAAMLRAGATGLAVLAVWGTFAVSQGGNWWRHYLVQLVPVLATGVGIVAGGVVDRSRSRIATGSSRSAMVVSVVAGVAWAIGVAWAGSGNVQREASVAGDWLRDVSRPGDTVVVTWGHPNVLRRSRLRSPYTFSWSLPIRVRDPHLDQLRAVLAGDDAPTWIVEWRPIDLWGLDRAGELRAVVALRYDRVATVCGRAVYRLSAVGSGSSSRVSAGAPSSDACDPPVIDGLLDRLRW